MELSSEVLKLSSANSSPTKGVNIYQPAKQELSAI
jgi:hypothetical protein